MNVILFILIFISHILATIPFWEKLRWQVMPNVSDFASLSFILYYDIGIILELIGISNTNIYFDSLIWSNDNIFAISSVILMITPWLFHLGSNLIDWNKPFDQEKYFSHLKRLPIFYIIVFLISIFLAILGYLQIKDNPIWVARSIVGEQWGPLIFILYLPMHFLAFYIRQTNSRTKSGLFFSIFLIFTSIMSTLQIGQRTNILLPFVIFLLFRNKITIKKLAVIIICGVISASIFLSIFKPQYKENVLSLNQLIVQTIFSDFSRSGILKNTIERTDLFGSNIIPYPMAGYLYSVFFFIPRSFIPLKGESTARYFTSNVLGVDAVSINWGFGVGVIEEILINGGFLLFIPITFCYGIAMGFVNRISKRVPSLVVPTRLAAIWLCGYNLPSLLLTFGVMAFICWLLNTVFSEKNQRKC
ncbi:MAG: hypothetical protein ACM3WV_07600 [Bacillota bacterium]